jgi:hypothetical protein
MEEKQKDTEQKPAETRAEPAHRSKPTAKIIVIVVIVLLLLALGWAAWQWWLCTDHHKQTEDEKKQLQTQIDGLKKELEAAKKTSASSSGSTTPCTVGTASQSLKDNISSAINTKNTAALEGYMASAVTVVLAASEKGGTETPAQATQSVEYTFNGTAPWDFNLSAATLSSYKAGFYKQYFPDGAYVGKAANEHIVSFGFDCNNKINLIFMSVSDDLLTS